MFKRHHEVSQDFNQFIKKTINKLNRKQMRRSAKKRRHYKKKYFR